jgi:hypothetical protein
MLTKEELESCGWKISISDNFQYYLRIDSENKYVMRFARKRNKYMITDNNEVIYYGYIYDLLSFYLLMNWLGIERPKIESFKIDNNESGRNIENTI